MALSQEKYPGLALSIVAAGARTFWINCEIVLNEDTVEAVASDDTGKPVLRTHKWLEGKLGQFIGATNNGATLPAHGDVISDLDVAVGSDSLLPDLSDYDDIKFVAPTRYAFEDGAAKSEVNFRSHVLN